jgi:YebC/PmpR family DNA-binding regulatory protein
MSRAYNSTMSGHSHYDTIHRQKELNDSKKGKIYSKMSKEIVIAVRTGGGTDPNFNYKLRMVMDKAREYNMPKSNVERAINSGTEGGALDEVMYEGFGPSGISVIIQAATDNRNRTSQEIKNVLERVGGSLTGPGSVSFNFENKGLLLVKKSDNPDEQTLQLIDLGVDDVEDTDDGLEVYVAPETLSAMRKKVEEAGFEVTSSELFMQPKTYMEVKSGDAADKVLSFLETLEDLDDVQKVYSNLDVVERQ